jgi:hypothetical protein
MPGLPPLRRAGKLVGTVYIKFRSQFQYFATATSVRVRSTGKPTLSSAAIRSGMTR